MFSNKRAHPRAGNGKQARRTVGQTLFALATGLNLTAPLRSKTPSSASPSSSRMARSSWT